VAITEALVARQRLTHADLFGAPKPAPKPLAAAASVRPPASKPAARPVKAMPKNPVRTCEDCRGGRCAITKRPAMKRVGLDRRDALGPIVASAARMYGPIPEVLAYAARLTQPLVGAVVIGNRIFEPLPL
jgi:hypothetical protein